MIKLKVKEYCQNCPDFDAKVTVSESELSTGDERIRLCDTTVTCSHAKRCAGIMRYLERMRKEEKTNG